MSSIVRDTAPSGASGDTVVPPDLSGQWYRGGGAAYYHELFVDPHRPDTIFSIDTNLERSSDGGKTWSTTGVGEHRDARRSPRGGVRSLGQQHILVGNDGGFYETYRRGCDVPLLHESAGDAVLPRVGRQREAVLQRVRRRAGQLVRCGPSRTINRWGIRTSDWFIVGSGDGFQTRTDPEDPDIVYASSQDGNLRGSICAPAQVRSIRPRISGPPVADSGADSLAAGRGSGRQPAGRQSAGRQSAGAADPQGGPPQGGGAGGAAGDRANWDAPYIISPHSSRRLYWAATSSIASDDRGDTWTRDQPGPHAQLKWEELPIMGKVWPADRCAYHESTTALSNVVSLDESPLLEGLIYAGTDDGLLQVTEDGGKQLAEGRGFPGVPQVDVRVGRVRVAARREHGVRRPEQLAARRLQALLVKSPDRGRTWTNISRQPARAS